MATKSMHVGRRGRSTRSARCWVLWPHPGEKRDGEGDSKPKIYVAEWMRKPGDRDPEDEDMATKKSVGVMNRRLAALSLRRRQQGSLRCLNQGP
jgi:hypothetical protein